MSIHVNCVSFSFSEGHGVKRMTQKREDSALVGSLSYESTSRGRMFAASFSFIVRSFFFWVLGSKRVAIKNYVHTVTELR